MSCPLCRSKLDRYFNPHVNENLQKQIKEDMKEMFEIRKNELVTANHWVGSKRLIQFSYGNTHSIGKDENGLNIHKWTMFVIFNEDKFATDQYI